MTGDRLARERDGRAPVEATAEEVEGEPVTAVREACVPTARAGAAGAVAEEHAVPDREALDPGAELDDPAHAFVAEHRRQRCAEAVLLRREIRVAEPDGLDRDEDLVGRRRSELAGLDPEGLSPTSDGRANLHSPALPPATAVWERRGGRDKRKQRDRAAFRPQTHGLPPRGLGRDDPTRRRFRRGGSRPSGSRRSRGCPSASPRRSSACRARTGCRPSRRRTPPR